MGSPTIADSELSAFLDRELSAARQAAIEACIAESPATAARLDALRRQSETLRARFGAASNQASDRSTSAALPINSTGRTHRSRQLADPILQPADLHQLGVARRSRLALVTASSFLAGGVVVAAVGAFLGYASTTPDARRAVPARPMTAVLITDPVQMIASRAIAAHRTFALDPDKPVEFADGGELAAQLGKRFGFSPIIPRLEAAGLRLLGGRVLPDEFGASLFLVYEGPDGARYGLTIGHAGALSAPTPVFLDAAINAELWTDPDRTFVLTARKGRDALEALAERVRAQASSTAPK